MTHLLREEIEKTILLTDEEFDLVLAAFKKKQFKKHQFIVQEQEPVLYEHFILSGLAKAAHLDKEGKEHITQFAFEGSWITDPHAYHSIVPASLNIDCLEDTETLALSREDRAYLYKRVPKMAVFFSEKTIADYITLQKRTLCLISTNAKERYESLLLRHPTLLQRVSKTHIASYLGLSRETLSRLLTT
ncbi:Crp/Fnr family transcriptional regulator [Chitinophaga nivalis]|uniref:Crp/Fnr family transcriptional regulator n=1 Tax=Chitinophaga nivalis TaxID=2991709 RepID=A0ABT3IS63_9BACT|nr:Crp/Fnr family transcriptional regulator [Chitinophaga nivalis]MCW3463489.1 Crp/Fnr family transcriptional regulator [Chitinophaga nivalis]MCW3486821.1 Crp/Fnr family transcriptional regulator [Chitinophaga nivalis]